MLEERLSKEVEWKERKRQQETQAMQRVEEEFQRKRAREKANIREQLRYLQYHQSPMAIHDGPLEKYRIDNSYSERKESLSNSRLRLDPEGAPSISHHRSSSDELQKENVKSNNLVNIKISSSSRNARSGETQAHNNHNPSRAIRESRDSSRKETTAGRLGYIFLFHLKNNIGYLIRYKTHCSIDWTMHS